MHKDASDYHPRYLLRLSNGQSGAAKRDNGNLTVGSGTVASEAWICRNHLVEQRGAFLALGYTGPGGEALTFSFDGDNRVGC